jgi:hypothetical protein
MCDARCRPRGSPLCIAWLRWALFTVFCVRLDPANYTLLLFSSASLTHQKFFL